MDRYCRLTGHMKNPRIPHDYKTQSLPDCYCNLQCHVDHQSPILHDQLLLQLRPRTLMLFGHSTEGRTITNVFNYLTLCNTQYDTQFTRIPSSQRAYLKLPDSWESPAIRLHIAREPELAAWSCSDDQFLNCRPQVLESNSS